MDARFRFGAPAILLSGFATPIENMPDWLQLLTMANPLRRFLVVGKGVFLKRAAGGRGLPEHGAARADRARDADRRGLALPPPDGVTVPRSSAAHVQTNSSSGSAPYWTRSNYTALRRARPGATLIESKVSFMFLNSRRALSLLCDRLV